MSELLPCRKCGSYNYELWDGRGVQPEMYCNCCGQSESVQLCDLFDYTDERRHAGFIDDNFTNRPDIVEHANAYLFNEWNTRAVSPLQQARLNFIESYRKLHDENKNGQIDAMVDAWSRLQQIEGESNG